MNAISIRKSTAYILVGLIGLALAAGYLVLSFRLPFGRMDQPGAAIFPIIVGITLVLGSSPLSPRACGPAPTRSMRSPSAPTATASSC